MELAAAAGSAATVVQLVDFAGRTLKSTTTFIASVASASKELETLRLQVHHLEQLFENTRILACSYQNTPLALEPQNKATLELLGHALTKCSVNLQELNCLLQKPVAQADWGIVRMKRRVKHVLDEATLRRLSSRLQDSIVSLNFLQSGISMHNDSIMHGSIREVAGLVQHLPQLSAQLTDLHQQSAQPIVIRLDQIDQHLQKLNSMNNQFSAASTSMDTRVSHVNGCFTTGHSINPTLNAIGRFGFAGIPTEELFSALELFAPAFRTGMQFLYQSKEMHISQETLSWVRSQFHELLADAHGAGARSYSHIVTENGQSNNDFETAMVPRRLYREARFRRRKNIDESNSDTPASPNSSVSAEASRHEETGVCRGKVMTESGQLHASFEGTLWSEQWPVANVDSGLVSICFIPDRKLKLPGIVIAFFRHPEDADTVCHGFLTTFDIVPPDASIFQAVKDGDRGVSKVLQMLKSGQHWAGDRDEEGRSLLSYAIQSGSRDMCALLLRMGAHPQDAYNLTQMQFPPVQHIRS